MNKKTADLLKQALTAVSALNEEPDVVIDEESMGKAVGTALARVMASEDFMMMLNTELGVALERQGLGQFNNDKFMVAVDSIGLGTNGAIIAEAIGPGVGKKNRATIVVK